jgi:4-coumarate--CoA ligase
MSSSPPSSLIAQAIMTTEKVIYRSPYPEVKLPETSCWHFIFDNQTSSSDDRVVFADGLSEKKLR